MTSRCTYWTQWPSDILFSNSGAPGYQFHGVITYSVGIDPPSSAPSEAPSNIPTTSFQPSFLSEVPSDLPSNSLMPSSAPTKVPTAGPTGAPTFDLARIQIKIPASLTVQGFNLEETQVKVVTLITILSNSITDLVRMDLRSTQRLKGVNILSINGIPVTDGQSSSLFSDIFGTRRLTSRILVGSIDAQYEIILEQICATQTCDDAQEVANTLYEQVTVSMQREIESGAFENAMEVEAFKESLVLELDVVEPEFENLVVTVLALLSVWYPTWKDGQYCENDGNERELSLQ